MAELAEIPRTACRHDRSDDLAAFAAHVSHELKSPLTAIQGAAELIRDAEADMSAEERAAFLNNIIKDTERLALLVRRLLELARADAREDDMGETAVADLAGAIRAPIEVEVRDTDAPRLSISAEKLGIVLTNLADNAARHGARRVSIDVARKGDEAVITVSDDGEGISPANRAKVFEPFFTTRRTAGGTGMGLPIIKALIEARDGSTAGAARPSHHPAAGRLTGRARGVPPRCSRCGRRRSPPPRSWRRAARPSTPPSPPP